MLVAVSVVVSVFVLLVVTLRMTRNVKFKKFGWDEMLISLATVMLLATVALDIASVPFGNGRHIFELKAILSDPFKAIELTWAGQPLSTAALLVAKSSLAVTLLKLRLGKKFNWVVVGAVVLLAMANIWFIIQIVAGCNPRSSLYGAPCRSSVMSYISAYFQCAANTFVNIVFSTTPEFFLRKTQVNPREKLAIRCLLGFVFAATIMSIVKVIYVHKLLRYGDVTWNCPVVEAAATTEGGLSIIAACLPAVQQLAGQRFPEQVLCWKTTSDHVSQSSSATSTPTIDNSLSNGNDVENLNSIAQVKILNDLDFTELERHDRHVRFVGLKPAQSVTLNDSHGHVSIPKMNVTLEKLMNPLASPSHKPMPARMNNTYADSQQRQPSSRYRGLTPYETVSATTQGTLSLRRAMKKQNTMNRLLLTPNDPIDASDVTSIEDSEMNIPTSGSLRRPYSAQDHSYRRVRTSDNPISPAPQVDTDTAPPSAALSTMSVQTAIWKPEGAETKITKHVSNSNISTRTVSFSLESNQTQRIATPNRYRFHPASFRQPQDPRRVLTLHDTSWMRNRGSKDAGVA